MTNETSAVVVSQEQFRRPSWERSVAFDDAAADCERAIEGSTFAPGTSEERQEGYKTACRLMSMSMKLAASRAAPDGFASTPQAASAMPDGVWLPIGSAPKDGSVFFARGRNWGRASNPYHVVQTRWPGANNPWRDANDDSSEMAYLTEWFSLAASPECLQAASAEVREDNTLRRLVERAQLNIPEWYVNWHADARNALAAVPAHAPSAGEGVRLWQVRGPCNRLMWETNRTEGQFADLLVALTIAGVFAPAAPTGNADAESGS